MKLVKPSVELWSQGSNDNEHIARCARVCYASSKQDNCDTLVHNLELNKHMSMFRHLSKYYIIPQQTGNYRSILQKLIMFNNCPYINYEVIPTDNGKDIFISTNGQFIKEHPILNDSISFYGVSFNLFKEQLKHIKTWQNRERLENLFRYTFCVTTQISTSRELNRVSPNNISEQSTRYVNFGLKGGITICEPWWYRYISKRKRFLSKLSWKLDEIAYNICLKYSKHPQVAREFLPLCTATKCVYTYTLAEWRHIIDLRYYGTTGMPHPNAMIIAKDIRKQLMNLNHYFRDKE